MYFRDRAVYRDAEHGSFIDPSQPAPHAVYYYEKTFHVTPERPKLSNTASLLLAPDLTGLQAPATGNEPNALQRCLPSVFGEDEEERPSSCQTACQKKCKCCGAKSGARRKFGLWEGVVVPALLGTFGVIMFLRIPFIVGQSGIWQVFLIMLVSTVITLITATSMSAIATNGKMKGGGAYFLISRNLGPQFGGVIGVLYSLGQAIAISFYLTGCAETLTQLAGAVLTGDPQWDVRLWSNLVLLFLLAMVLIGVAWVVRAQLVLLALLLFVVLSVLVGAAFPPAAVVPRNTTAFVGFSAQALAENTLPAYLNGDTFFSMFALFFPAITGTMTGANLSGDLQFPGRDIPRGTFIAIGFAMFVYLLLAVWCGATVFRTELDGSGGLYYDELIMTQMSFWSPLVYVGIFLATISSALNSLVGAPRIAQSFCKDKIFVGKFIEPIEAFLATGRKRTNDPIPLYFVTFLIAVGFNLIGDLNTIAPIISMFFMITFGLINLACFAGSIVKAPGWRPSFRLYHPWLSLSGAALCAVAMFLISWWAALVACAVGALLFIILAVWPPPVQWGPSGHAYQIAAAVDKALALQKIPLQANTWRPHIQVLVGSVEKEMALLKFSYDFNKGGGMVLALNVMKGEFREMLPLYSIECRGGYLTLQLSEVRKQGGKMKDHKRIFTMFYDVVIADTFRHGVQRHFFCSGVGKLKPNCFMIGFPERWRSSAHQKNEEYMNIVRDAFEIGQNCMVVRGAERINYTQLPTMYTDVWWLVDDGGFTVLMPWLLAQRKFWTGTKLRIFTVPGSLSIEHVAQTAANFEKLVSEFNIPASVHVEIPDPISDDEFYSYLQNTQVQFAPDVLERTKRYMLLAKLIKDNSADTGLLFCTLPFPPDEVVAENWLAWLDMISDMDLCTVFLRGNQQSLLKVFV